MHLDRLNWLRLMLGPYFQRFSYQQDSIKGGNLAILAAKGAYAASLILPTPREVKQKSPLTQCEGTWTITTVSYQLILVAVVVGFERTFHIHPDIFGLFRR